MCKTGGLCEICTPRRIGVLCEIDVLCEKSGDFHLKAAYFFTKSTFFPGMIAISLRIP